MHFFSSTAIPAIEGTYEAVKGLVTAFADLPGPLQIAAGAGLAWAVAGDRILGGLKPLGSAFGGLKGAFSNFSTDLAYARDNGYGAALAFKELGARAGGQTLGALKALGSAIGPELGIAAAAGGVALLATDFQKITNAGGDARDEIDQVNRSLRDMGNAARIDAATASINQLRDSLASAQAILDSGGGDQGGFASFLGFTAVAAGQAASMKDAQAAVDAYKDAIADLENKQNQASDTADRLTGSMGMTRDQVLQLADAAGIDLSQGYDAVYGKMLLYRDAQDAANGATQAASSARWPSSRRRWKASRRPPTTRRSRPTSSSCPWTS
jgi:hypothetical protein